MLGRLLATLSAPQPRTVPAFNAANLPAMRGPLEIIRDRNDVLHIYADQERDLYAALGFAQAADRFFTLDLTRHLGAGRLSRFVGNLKAPKRTEMFGGRRVAEIDGFVRPLGFETQSRADLTRLSARAADLLDAFADGVNAGLRAMRGCYPAEYLFVGAVEPWHPADCLVTARTCAFTVTLAGLDNELTFDAVRGALGDEAARRFYPDAPWENAPTSYSPRGPVPEPEVPIEVDTGGSNNWAVAPTRAAHGAPLVANDPHVPFLLPTFWHHVHLDCPTYRVQGGIFPGCPVFGFGHNGALAWGCTTGFRDAYDFYRIHRLPDDAARYRTERGSGAITKHREVLPARLQRQIVIEWESCEHGVIYPGWRHHDGVDLAMRTVACDLAHYFEGYLALAASETVDEHRRTLSLINDGPFDFNHVYAHRDGAIGWELFGRAPRRRRDGLFVRDAQDPDGAWDGWIPFDEMPKSLDPPRGYVATANAMTDSSCLATFTAVHCEPRYRTARIESVLESTAPHSTDTSAALQRDVLGSYAATARCAGGRDRRHRRQCGRGRRAAHFRSWDGTFPSDSCGALIYAGLQQDLVRRLFVPVLGHELGNRYANGRRGMPRLHRLLLDAQDPLRADVERATRSSFADLVRDAFFAAVSRLSAAQGPDTARWRWGSLQRIRLGTALSLLPGIGARFVAFEGPFPGDEYTVSPSRSVPMRGKLYSMVGATSRFICDLATPDEALFAHSAGPSADPRSAFFANLSPSWHRYEYFRSALWKADEVPDRVEHLVIPARP
jgi:penicillin amidase